MIRKIFFIITLLLGLSLTPRPGGTAEEGLRVVFFFSPGCRECDEIRELLIETEEKLGIPLDIQSLDITQGENIELLWAWEDRAEKQADGLTALVIGDEFFAGYREIKQKLEAAVRECSQRDQPPRERPSVKRTIESEFNKFGPWAVIGAGLIDGINPCAFVVLVLLISFLTVAGESPGQTARIGIAFALAVFLTYFLVGLGLFSVIVQSLVYRKAAEIIYLVVGGFSLLLGVVSLHDALVVYRSREIKDARLKLPPLVLRWIQKVMSRNFNPRHIFLSALVLGFLVSLLELVCTGQIYLPTIILIMKNQLLRKKAVHYLLLYCLAFIVPLLVVFGTVYLGSGNARLTELTRKYSWFSKILTGVIFIALAIFLFTRI